jgi:RNA polymerase sigma factor (sigma-70 family)
MKIKLYQRVSLTQDLPEHNLRKEDEAVVVELLPATPAAGDEAGYALEVFNDVGETIDVVMVNASVVELLDEELMVNAQEEDDEAFNELERRYHQTVWSVSYRLLKGSVDDPWEDAKECTQEMFIKAFCARHTYNEQKGKVSSWLLRIATHTTIDFLRNRQEAWWRSLLSLDETFEGEEGEETARGELAHSSALLPDEVAVLNELVEQVRRCLAQLNPAEQAALVMRHVEEQPLQEIADALGIGGTGRHVQATRLIKRAETKFRKLWKLYERGDEV